MYSKFGKSKKNDILLKHHTLFYDDSLSLRRNLNSHLTF